MGKGGLVTYESSDFFRLLFQIRGSIFDNVLSKVRPPLKEGEGGRREGASARATVSHERAVGWHDAERSMRLGQGRLALGDVPWGGEPVSGWGSWARPAGGAMCASGTRAGDCGGCGSVTAPEARECAAPAGRGCDIVPREETCRRVDNAPRARVA